MEATGWLYAYALNHMPFLVHAQRFGMLLERHEVKRQHIAKTEEVTCEW
jgi:hypothetical protein